MKTDSLYSFWARGFLAEQALTEFGAGTRAPGEDERADRVRRVLTFVGLCHDAYDICIDYQWGLPAPTPVALGGGGGARAE